MATFLNESGLIGLTLANLTENVTGSEYVTILILILAMAAILGAIRMPIEWIGLLVFPFVIVAMAFNTAFIGLGIGILMFLSLIYAYLFFG